METLENNILGTNKIPGSEKFTRPEEIKALSKYLGNIRKVQNNHTKLGEESLALYGRNTGKLVDIKNLEDHQFLDKISDNNQPELVKDARPILNNEGDDVIDLLQKKIELVESENERGKIDKLSDKVEKISDTLDIENLPTKTVELSPDEAPENWTEKLLKDVIKLQGNKDITDLPTNKVELDTPNKTIPLSEKKEELGVDNEIQSLRPHQKLEELKDNRTTSLSNKRENLVDNREIELDSTVDNLNVRENIELSEYQDKISDDRFIELDNKREDIDVNEDISLSNHVESIEVTDINSLPENKLELGVSENISLSDYSEKLNIKEDPELSDHIETIEDKRNTSLSDYRERIEVSDIDSLSNKKVDIEDDREIKLSKEKLDIKSEDKVEKLPNDNINLLDNHGSDANKLSDFKEELKDSTTKSLEELSDKRLDISDNREVELNKGNISPEEKPTQEVELSEEQVQILEGKNREPSELVDGKVKLNVEDLIDNLPGEESKENIEDNSEVSELSQFVDSLNVTRTFQPLTHHTEMLDVKEKVDKLEDGMYVIDNDTRPPIGSLPDKSLKVKPDENKSIIRGQYESYIEDDSFNKAVNEILQSKDLDNTGLFNRVMKLLQDIKKDSTAAIGSKEWVEKTEALISSYFNTDNKEFLDVDKDDFVNSWINYITVNIPENDKRQFDPLKSEVQAVSNNGDSAFDSFFSFLLKANSVNELSQLLNLYKSKVANLKVPEIDNFKDKEIIPDTIQALQELIKERGGKADITTPQNNNTFDSNKYILTSLDGSQEFDFIGALINTSDLETFKQILTSHNTKDNGFKQKLSIKNISYNNYNWVENLTHTLFYHRRGEIAPETWKMLGQKYGIYDNYDKNSKRPSHNVRDVNGNWEQSDSDPLTDEAGNVDLGKFNSHKVIELRGEYKLPENATWGNLKKNFINEDGGVNVFGVASLLSNPGASLNLNKYLRWTAEKLTDAVYGLYTRNLETSNKKADKISNKHVRSSVKGFGKLTGSAITQFTGIPTNKRRMLEETLGMLVYLRDLLERSTGANRDRLPGSSLFSQFSAAALNRGTKGIGDRLLSMAKSAISGGNSKGYGTRNRPHVVSDAKFGLSSIFGSKSGNSGPSSYNTETVAFEDNRRGKSLESWKNIENKFMKANFGYTPGIVTLNSRFALPGIKTTLKELAGYDVAEKKPVESLEKLKEILINAPNITTPNKFSACRYGYRAQSLSSNSFWEIKLEPFVHNNMNGGFSYLPSIREINVANLRNHGIYTGYNEWLPITNFEFDRSKLATKSLGIYEGEIVYPTGCEFLNELSITMINDSLKSWSGYWRKVMEVATHNSEPHPASFYQDPYPIPTAIDLSAPVIALYKNVTWRCRIYILTPQYSTVRKFDLLVVLKDYTESYVGEIDSPGGDIQLRFSVVGENPPEETPLMSADIKGETKTNIKQTTSISTNDKVEEGGGSGKTKDQSEKSKEEGEKTPKTDPDPTPKDPPEDQEKPGDNGEVPKDPPSDRTTNKTTTNTKGKTSGTGNCYYAIIHMADDSYYIEKRPGDPNKDPDALMFTFDKDLSGKHMPIYNAYTNSAWDNSPTNGPRTTDWSKYFDQKWFDNAKDEELRNKTRDYLWEISNRRHTSNKEYRN